MPVSTVGSGLASLALTNPQHDPEWANLVVPAAATGPAGELSSALRDLRADVIGAGRSRGLEEWVTETSSTSLLVLDQATVVHEWYADGLGADTRFLGASMTKSVLAHLVGLAVRAGALALTDAVTRHVPELAGTGYDGTTVLDLLTMTTGVDWVEDHRNPDSLASRLLVCFATDADSRALLRRVRPGVLPGTRFSYCTADSQVLDWVRERATSRSYPDDVARLWAALGCTGDAYVAVDGTGVTLAGGGLAATARDWARVARLAVDGCSETGERLLEPEWVEAAARPAYPFPVARIENHWTLGAPSARTSLRRRRSTGHRPAFPPASCDARTVSTPTVQAFPIHPTRRRPAAQQHHHRQARDLSYLGLHALLDAALPQTTKEQAP